MTKHSCAWASMRDCRALVLSAAMSGVGGVCRYANTISRSLWYVPAAPYSACVRERERETEREYVCMHMYTHLHVSALVCVYMCVQAFVCVV